MTSSQHNNAFGQFETHTDVGSLQYPGSCAYDVEQQMYSIVSAGANIWGNHDDFHFVWKRMTGDFIVTTRAALIGEGKNPHRKLGWMARATLDTSSPNVCTGIHGDGLLTLQFRRTQGAETEEVRSPLKSADVIQLERKGTTYIMSVARYGEPFVAVQATDIDLGDELYVGLYVCSHEEDIVERAAFRDVRIVVPVKSGFERGKDPFGSHLEILEVASGNRKIIYSADNVFEAPNWTRDGKALIYNSNGRLYRFDLTTKVSTLIDTGEEIRNNNDHVISFDGTMLAISSHRKEDNVSLVYTVPIQGGAPKRVTTTGPSYLHGWSPDGKYLVYTGLRNGDYDIYRIAVDGGAETQLTAAIGLDDGPEYTPDGKYIYFNSVRSGRMHIWRMKADGSDQEQLTDDEYNNWFPHISPDGKWVIFLTYLINEVEPSDHPAAKRVYLRLMPLDGGTPKVLAYLYGGQGTINVPSWSPDGKYVAFVSNTVPH
ncbi:periplasmic component of the Tol biopolymer transport system-like protein [Candidatus Moduliflexus flocculans]|uniref:Periplasmic component of the Tol biopolymer transport system-like protein n=1 Tax=Candidatus Moduliflexus flocculans TaxID=1499966 RepID=A0A0S6VS94_9BACT|nr:periplasmic component of the Tol biopolymer transport system-like protein [Candidatus Moduliflexus flocculans]